MMNDLGIIMGELSQSWKMIQGFNLKSQLAVDMICLELAMGDLSNFSILYEIDAKASYKLLLR